MKARELVPETWRGRKAPGKWVADEPISPGKFHKAKFEVGQNRQVDKR